MCGSVGDCKAIKVNLKRKEVVEIVNLKDGLKRL
jgi:hypothetical protein